MLLYLAVGLIVGGAVGILIRTLEFVRVTLPENYGVNPGFGCYESMIAPWYALVCVGVGLLTASWVVGGVALLIGLFASGFLAMLLGRLFGRRS
jgi:hypothetical protein